MLRVSFEQFIFCDSDSKLRANCLKGREVCSGRKWTVEPNCYNLHRIPAKLKLEMNSRVNVKNELCVWCRKLISLDTHFDLLTGLDKLSLISDIICSLVSFWQRVYHDCTELTYLLYLSIFDSKLMNKRGTPTITLNKSFFHNICKKT